jgi:hypothetical protein
MRIKVLRDTGQSLILHDVLPLSDVTATGNNIFVQGVGSGQTLAPLHLLHLSHNLVKGDVILGVISELPVKGIHLLLGNDLASGEVFPQVITQQPVLSADICEEPFEVFPACVVTRSMGKDVIIPKPPPVEDTPQLVKDGLKLPVHISHSDFLTEQKRDGELQKIRLSINSTGSGRVRGSYYYLNNELLCHKYVPTTASPHETWLFKNQLIVPKLYRPKFYT